MMKVAAMVRRWHLLMLDWDARGRAAHPEDFPLAIIRRAIQRWWFHR